MEILKPAFFNMMLADWQLLLAQLTTKIVDTAFTSDHLINFMREEPIADLFASSVS